MARPVRVILYGLGPIGAEIGRLLAQRPGIEIVGAVEVDPTKAGRDLGQVIGLRTPLGVLVSTDSKQTLKKSAQVVVHATGSHLKQVYPQLEAILSARHNVISTCEELADAWANNPSEAKHLDALARENQVTILGAGVNPGFAMDALPLMLTGAMQQVKHVRVRRIVDAAPQRLPLQKRIGIGLTAAEFRERVGRGELRHVGLAESASLIARGLDWKLSGIQETVEPVLAARALRTAHFSVPPNFVAGLKQRAVATADGEPVIELDLQMTIDNPPAADEVWIEGVPNLHSKVEGIHGDLSAAAVVANTLRRLGDAPAGLVTLLDLPLVTAR